jgi:polygalacturonase
LDDIEDDFIRPNEEAMLALGKPIMRSFPKQDQFGKLILLLRCRDVLISGVSLINSPSWTLHPYGCERMVFDGGYVSDKEVPRRMLCFSGMISGKQKGRIRSVGA